MTLARRRGSEEPHEVRAGKGLKTLASRTDSHGIRVPMVVSQMAPERPTHRCRCQSGRRAAAVLLGGQEDSLPEFRSIAGQMAMRYSEELSVIVFEIADERPIRSASELRAFLEAQWASASSRLSACWIDPAVPLGRQLQALADARSLEEWAGTRASPLAKILSCGRIDTWFQPVFESARLDLWGYECLARARGEDGEIIPPADLFRWAKEDDLTFMLDRVCRETHIRNVSRVDERADLTFLINFLPTVIYDPKVCLRTTFEAAKDSKVRPEQIIFEVVESERVLDADRLSDILDEYRAAGFRVALDDLGAGHASLSLLGDLSPDLIKIDRSLISKSTSSTIHRSICRSVVDIARSNGKRVLAEGVETLEEYALFAELGVDLFQGYLFGRPAAEPVRRAAIEPLSGIDDAPSRAA